MLEATLLVIQIIVEDEIALSGEEMVDFLMIFVAIGSERVIFHCFSCLFCNLFFFNVKRFNIENHLIFATWSPELG